MVEIAESQDHPIALDRDYLVCFGSRLGWNSV